MWACIVLLGITSCKFTPSGDAVVVANQDGVLKVNNYNNY